LGAAGSNQERKQNEKMLKEFAENYPNEFIIYLL